MKGLKLVILITITGCIYGLPVHQLNRSEPYNDSLVVGGVETSIRNFRSIVRLIIVYHIEEVVYNRLCGGTAISHLVILTAGHCLDYNVQGIFIKVGITSIHEAASMHVKNNYHSLVFKKHPHYNETTREYDIGLIGVNIDPEVPDFSKAKLPFTSSPKPAPPQIVYGFGWGSVDGLQSNRSDTLHVVALPVIQFYVCFHILWPWFDRVVVTKEMFCTGDLGDNGRGANVCYGDSGGPIVDHNGIVVGVISSLPIPCLNKYYPSVHINVARVRAWILLQAGV